MDKSRLAEFLIAGGGFLAAAFVLGTWARSENATDFEATMERAALIALFALTFIAPPVYGLMRLCRGGKGSSV